MKLIYSGLESSGKSLQLAYRAVELVYRNRKWYRRLMADYTREVKFATKRNLTLPEKPIIRPIVSNMRFSDEFYAWATQVMKVPIVYWKDLEELIGYTEADIICDEVGNYFDARMWPDLSLDVRRWLTQGAKQGIEFYGGAQDFAQVDKAFRRLVQPGDLVHITKLAGSRRPSKTKPGVKFIWGVCMVRKLNPQGYDEDKKDFSSSSIFPTFFFIKKRYCQIFDTGQKLERSAPPPFRHTERFCEEPGCAHHRIIHV